MPARKGAAALRTCPCSSDSFLTGGEPPPVVVKKDLETEEVGGRKVLPQLALLEAGLLPSGPGQREADCFPPRCLCRYFGNLPRQCGPSAWFSPPRRKRLCPDWLLEASRSLSRPWLLSAAWAQPLQAAPFYETSGHPSLHLLLERASQQEKHHDALWEVWSMPRPSSSPCLSCSAGVWTAAFSGGSLPPTPTLGLLRGSYLAPQGGLEERGRHLGAAGRNGEAQLTPTLAPHPSPSSELPTFHSLKLINHQAGSEPLTFHKS